MRRSLMVVCTLVAVACSSSDNATGPGNSSKPTVDLTKPTAITLVSGSGQTVRIGSAVPNPMTFKVTNSAGTGLSDVTVTFSVAAGGGSLGSNSAVTGTDGSVSVPTWTMGTTAGTNTLAATVGSSIQATVSATARLPYWTVMVYMAADNTLAAYGVVNLLQMALAGVNPEVQVVVEAEFNPEAFAMLGWTPAIVDRPNYNTFRYAMDGSVSRPPNNTLIGPATDIGNVNMTDPAQLRSFVQWAEQAAPAEHTTLVLWNHGGDQSGLIEDETSAPQTVMTLAQLHSALSGLPSIDVLYFEMCLMGGYEPLSAVKDIAKTVVASEDAEYVAGWDFHRFLQTMYSDPAASAQTMAGRLADAFDAAYGSLGLSETISAYNMSGFAAVDAAISQFGNALLNSPSTGAASLASAAAGVQRYEMPWVADLVDLADSIQAHVTDPTVLTAAGAVRSAATSSSFLLTNHYRTGTVYEQRDESRSHGLTIVMPGAGTTAMPSAGTASMAAYTQQFPTSSWSTFLQAYTAGIQAQSFVNVGASPLTLYLVWDTVFAKRGWLEMLMLEPDGSLYSPIFGSLSPSGRFTADAQASQTYYEGWASNQYVESGEYYYLAWLVSDSTNYQPVVDVQYRFGSASLTSLYAPGPYPQLSLQTSFFNDPNASLTNVLNGSYSDLKAVATWTTPAASGARTSPGPPTVSARGDVPGITQEQIQALRDFRERLRSGGIPLLRHSQAVGASVVSRMLPRPLVPRRR